MKNSSLKKIGFELMQGDNVLLFPHVHADGDALGSCSALCLALRRMGKEAWVLLEEFIPDRYQFLDKDCMTRDIDKVQAADVCIALDLNDESRLETRLELFHKGKVRLCLDHHLAVEPIGDFYHVDSGAAATGELVYLLLKELNIEIDNGIAEGIYTAICTDTGNFQYSNTRKLTHLIAAELLESGIDHNQINVNINQNISRPRVLLTAKAVSESEFFCDGRGAVSCVGQEDFLAMGALDSDTDGIVESLRNISGVEAAVFLKEKTPGVIRISMRSKNDCDVSQIARNFGGGGHKKAAGCTINGTLEDAKVLIKKAVSEALSNK